MRTLLPGFFLIFAENFSCIKDFLQLWGKGYFSLLSLLFKKNLNDLWTQVVNIVKTFLQSFKTYYQASRTLASIFRGTLQLGWIKEKHTTIYIYSWLRFSWLRRATLHGAVDRLSFFAIFTILATFLAHFDTWTIFDNSLK